MGANSPDSRAEDSRVEAWAPRRLIPPITAALLPRDPQAENPQPGAFISAGSAGKARGSPPPLYLLQSATAIRHRHAHLEFNFGVGMRIFETRQPCVPADGVRRLDGSSNGRQVSVR